MRTVRQLLAEKPAEVHAVAPEAPVIEAIRLMAAKSIGAVLVLRGDALEGILSERDYARKVVLQGRSSADTPASAIMTAQVVTVAPDTPLRTAAETMIFHKYGCLPMVADGELVGIITETDFLKLAIFPLAPRRAG